MQCICDLSAPMERQKAGARESLDVHRPVSPLYTIEKQQRYPILNKGQGKQVWTGCEVIFWPWHVGHDIGMSVFTQTQMQAHRYINTYYNTHTYTQQLFDVLSEGILIGNELMNNNCMVNKYHFTAMEENQSLDTQTWCTVLETTCVCTLIRLNRWVMFAQGIWILCQGN